MSPFAEPRRFPIGVSL